MLVSVTAPKKGLGQSVTAINLGAALVQSLEKKALLIDLNRYCRDLSFYLSDAPWTRGLDEYKNMKEGGVPWQEGDFHKCTKRINPFLDMMAANQCLEISCEDLRELFSYTKDHYGITIVDTIGGNHPLTQETNQQADLVVVVLSQELRVLDLIKEYQLYQGIKEKVIFVVNRWIEFYQGERIKVDLRVIGKEIRKMGFGESKILTLPFDPRLWNECNDSTLLNFVFTKEETSDRYYQGLNHLVTHLTALEIPTPQDDLINATESNVDRKSLLKLLKRWDRA